MKQDPQLRAHRDWLGTLQPVGLVVSPVALVEAQCVPDQSVMSVQKNLVALVEAYENQSVQRHTPSPTVGSFLDFARDVLEWDLALIAGAPNAEKSIPEALSVALPEFGETLSPTYCVPNLHRSEPSIPWQLLVVTLPVATSLDDAGEESGRRWHASPTARIERLLRETQVGIGLLFNGQSLRLVYAPRGETSGHITWPVSEMCEVMGRPVLASLRMLLGSFRLFAAPGNQSLPHVLRESRKYQNVVSTQLADQVLEALHEILRGFQGADEASRGRLLSDAVRDDPDHVYGGLLAVLLRLVFVLFAEERGLMADGGTYARHYALSGLFERLRVDAGRYPDTMDQRYGAWSQVCVLFRMIYDGARHGEFELPARHGQLFDPDAWPFLEGRQQGTRRKEGVRLDIPRVSDGVVFRVLEKLLSLNGDRLSYRALDVEQVGSVYENMMGFTLQRATEISLGVGPQHVVVGLQRLLAVKPSDRVKDLKEHTAVELKGKSAEALKTATTIEAVVAAIGSRRSSLTPTTIPSHGLYLQPSEERRRSGSHYTPRSLTEPVVRTTLKPILDGIAHTGRDGVATPEAILALKVCDPSMGSGAFLVETCRQLAEALVHSWEVHGRTQPLPPDEDLLLFAQRQVVQRCLYGVDRNKLAVDLAKLSLWLATLARKHPFSFIDHSLREGDSLIGLTREQVAGFHWEKSPKVSLVRQFVEPALVRSEQLRQRIQSMSADDDDTTKRELLRESDEALADVRLIGDCVVACFFSADNPNDRTRALETWKVHVQNWLTDHTGREIIAAFVRETLQEDQRPIRCFHWEVEFPEVFADENSIAHVGAA
jgi:hypothetical protein